MAALRDIPFRIPDEWSASWFRQYHVEIIGKTSYATTGSFLTLADVAAYANAALDRHDADPFSHAAVIDAHKAEASPHPQYVLEAPIDGQQYVRMNGAWVIVTGPGVSVDNIILADGSNLLLADGSLLLTDVFPDLTDNFILETGGSLLLADGSSLLLLVPPFTYLETLLEDGSTLLFEDDTLVLLEEP